MEFYLWFDTITCFSSNKTRICLPNSKYPRIVRSYLNVSFSPFVISDSFVTHWWPCYFWPFSFAISVVFIIYKIISRFNIGHVIELISNATYEIFLIKMSFIYLFKYTILPFENKIAAYVLWAVITFLGSLLCGVLLRQLLNQKLVK